MRVRASGGRRREPQKAAPGEQAGARACGAKVHAGRGAVEASGGASPCAAVDAEACGAKSHAGRWRARVLVLGGRAVTLTEAVRREDHESLRREKPRRTRGA